MASFIAVDPGLRGCGCAIFLGRRLGHAGYVEGPLLTGRGPEVWRFMAHEIVRWMGERGGPVNALVAEVPEIYPGMPKTDPNDLIDLAGVVGAIAGVLKVPSQFYLPRQWKGQIPKSVGTLRALAALDDAERERVEPAPRKSLDHNTADAIGIGLFNVERFRKVQVFR